jgi:hypothetical protein
VVTSLVVRIVCRFQWEDLILHLTLWCPRFFLVGSEVHMFCFLSWSACLLRGSSFSYLGRTWCRSLLGPSALALVLSVHPGSLCKDSGHVFDFLRRLASPRTSLSRYLPQVRRALRRSVFSIDFCCVGRWFPCRRPVRTPLPTESAFTFGSSGQCGHSIHVEIFVACLDLCVGSL